MGQAEVLDLLKSNKNTWYTNHEIAYILKTQISSISEATKLLYKNKDIERIENGTHGFKYRYTN